MKNEEESSKLKQKISNIIDRAEQLKNIQSTFKGKIYIFFFFYKLHYCI